jgi:tripartite ATP-independent transporter DctM subunit
MADAWRHRASAAEAVLDRCIAAICGVVLALMLALVLMAVLARYLLGQSLFAAEDLALWLHASLVFFGLPLAARNGGAFRLDVLAQAFPRARAVFDTVAAAIVVHVMLLLAAGAGDAQAQVGGVSLALGLPEGWRFYPVAGGALLALLVIGLRIYADRSVVGLIVAIGAGIALYLAADLLAFETVARPSLLAAALLLGLTLLGAPLAHAMLCAVALSAPWGMMLSEAAIVQNTVNTMGRPLLLAIPLFLLAGTFMVAAGMGDRLMALARSLVGHWKGGMAQTTLATNLMFSGLSGSSIADAAFGAKVLYPALRSDAYPPERAAAIVAATSVLPNIVPPSIAFLILALATGQSVAALFTGGLLAGILIAGALSATLWLMAPAAAHRSPANARARWQAGRAAIPALGLAVVVLTGIRLGVVTITEAAALAAAYALAAALMAGQSVKAMMALFARTARETAAVGLLIASAAPLGFVLAIDDVSGMVVGLFASLDHVVLVLLAANLLLLAAGTILDIGAAILLLAPLLMPVAVAAGIDPVHFGVVIIVNLMIGGLTPPVGILVHVTSGLTGVAAGRIFLAVLPLLASLLGALILISAYAAIQAN